MRIDDNWEKKEKLINTRKNIINHAEKEISRKKFLAYGEFDRIGFERVERFSRFRDISENAKIWIGDRQTLLVYDIPDSKYQDGFFYEDGNFFVRGKEEPIQSDYLFLGITILQFKDSQKENQNNMSKFWVQCKRNILELVNRSLISQNQTI